MDMGSVNGVGRRCELEEARRHLAEELLKRREERGLSLEALAGEVGCCAGHLSKLESRKETNPSVWLVWRVAEVLEVPLQRLVSPAESTGSNGWTFAGWPWEGNEQLLVNHLEEAKLVLALSKWLDSHLLPDKMNKTFWKDRLLQATCKEEEKKMRWSAHMSFTEATRRIRDGSGSFEHRLLLRREFVETQHEADRIGIRDNLRKYYGLVKPSIVAPEMWRDVRTYVAEHLSWRTWQKLLVMDDKIAVVWLDHEDWLFTLDSREVGKVKRVLDTVLRELPVAEFNRRESDSIRRIFE